MNSDQLSGKIKKVKGDIREAAGKALGDNKMKNKGKIQNATGKIQEAYGNIKEDLKKEDLKNR